MRYSYAVIGALAVMALTGSSCDETAAPSAKGTQAERAQQAANSITFSDNAEIDNIKARLELTANPGLLGFIILLNDAGQPILYEGVKGKVTSGSKRLTKPYEMKTISNGNGGSNMVSVPGPSDEGTHGSSSEYVFYWNTDGQYRQWNGRYLYSDKPFRLRIEPLVISGQVEK